jgi:hypothetical protein
MLRSPRNAKKDHLFTYPILAYCYLEVRATQ